MTISRKIYLILSLMVVFSMLAASACTKATSTPEMEVVPTAVPEDVGEAELPITTEEPQPSPTVVLENITMTEYGTPRAETLIVDLVAASPTPDNFNPYTSGLIGLFQGVIQFHLSPLWDIDTKTGIQFPAMAAEPLKALDDTFIKWQIKLKEGLYWSDGIEITADDIAFTYHMILSNPTLPANAQLSLLIKDNIKVVDKYTLEIETTAPMPRLQQSLGVFLVYTPFQILPKHIWENVDPLTFNNNPPVGSGPYTLKEYDPNGTWFLWERREDWQRTDVGMLFGMPKPKYILFISYGTEEKRLLSAIDNNLDTLFDISPESWEILRTRNTYAQAWYLNFPWADFDDPCERGIELNFLKPPLDKTEVRWALALATDITNVSVATYHTPL